MDPSVSGNWDAKGLIPTQTALLATGTAILISALRQALPVLVVFSQAFRIVPGLFFRGN